MSWKIIESKYHTKLGDIYTEAVEAAKNAGDEYLSEISELKKTMGMDPVTDLVVAERCLVLVRKAETTLYEAEVFAKAASEEFDLAERILEL